MSGTARPFPPTQDLSPGMRLIEASAGTGKTWNISNLFVRLLAEAPLDALTVDRILVVTFTEAATADLRDRIRKRLREAAGAIEARLRGGPAPDDPVFRHLVDEGTRVGDLDDRLRRLREALESFDRASISTIHSFCQRMLRLNAFESRVAFDQELLTDIGPLLDEITQDFRVAATHDRWPALVRHLQDAHALRDLRDLAGAVGETAVPIVPDLAPDAPEPDLGQDRWALRVADFAPAWQAARDDVVAAILAAIDGGRMKASWQAEVVIGAAGEVDRWLADGADPSEARAGALRWFRQSVAEDGARSTKGVRRPPEHPFLAECEAFALAADAQTAIFDAWAAWMRGRFVGYVRRELARRKAARRVQSFQDLLGLLRERLDGEAGDLLTAAVRARFDAALIDEFQDTDPVQWAIFQRVFIHPEGRLYLIGDPKQAIYAFRHADVFAYLQAKAATPEDDRFTLTVNHRADRPMVDVLNRMFGRLDPLPFAFDEIPYDPVSTPGDAVRIRRGNGPVPPFHVTFLPGAADGKPQGKGEVDARVPGLVAREIREFLASGAEVRDASGVWRPVRPGDIAVLVRKNRQAEAVQQALRAAGVPGVRHGADNVLRTEEAGEIALVLAALLEPARIARLKPAMATRLVGVSANEIASFEKDVDALDARVDLFRGLSETWAGHGFSRMFRELLDRTGAVARLLDAPGGERRVTNLLHVAELAGRAEFAGGLKPGGVAAWLGQQMRATSVEAEAVELRLESDAEAVEILTMHRSKGLEFPLVWCPYLWDDMVGVGDVLKFHDPDDGFRAKLDIGSDADDRARHQEQALFEAHSENLRMLYVALTRAKHRCAIVAGHVKGVGGSPLGWLLHRRPGADAREMFAATAQAVAALGSDALLDEVRALEGPDLTVRVDGVAVAAAGPAGAGPGGAGTAEAGDDGAAAAPRVAARAWRRQREIDASWRRVSFSGLIQGDEAPQDGPRAEGKERDEGEPAAGDAPAGDGHPAPDGQPLGVVVAERPGATPILFADLKPGRETGDCLHDILEHIDFRADRGDWMPVIAKGLARYGMDPGLADGIAHGLVEVLATPLDGPGGAVRLRDVGLSDRRSELAFEFPVHDDDGAAVPSRVGRAMLAAPFRDLPGGALDPDYWLRVRALPFPAFHGFLRGFVDLVFRVGDRWYLLDYKSNHLGATREAYDAAAMAAAMAEGHYYLQYHLYAVALHRFLAWRLPGYRYQDHFGGVFYLFLRGMPGGAGGGDTGVFRDVPPRERIEALSALMG